MRPRTSLHRPIPLTGFRLWGAANGDKPSRHRRRPPWWLPVLTVLAAIAVGADVAVAQEVAPIGTYSTVRQSGEHCSGYSVDLWRTAGTIRGLFHSCQGLAGDLPAGLIERSSYDEKSGRLSFETRLTLGNDYVEGREVPSKDLFTFDGRLGAAELAGTLKKIDQVYDDDKGVTERIRLRKQRATLPSYPSLDDWRRQADQILKINGPKW